MNRKAERNFTEGRYKKVFKLDEKMHLSVD